MNHIPLRIGFARLSDAATIAAAKERGTFEAFGLDVSLTRFRSWAALRDALGTGAIDAAHMLSPMVVASAAGLGPFPNSFTTAFTLNLNGNAITVSNALFAAMQKASPEALQRIPLTADAVAAVIRSRHEQKRPPLTFAHVYTHSMHAYQLRYWLGAAGIDPDRDVRLVVIPPSMVVDALESGEIDGYCVGEPWNTAACESGVGRTLITSAEIWSNGPEKVLATRQDFAADQPEIHLQLLRALLTSSAWVDQPENRMTAARIVGGAPYTDMPVEKVSASLTGKDRQTAGGIRLDMPDFNVFYRYAANFPWRSHAKWILAQMVRWGEAPPEVDYEDVARRAFRPDIFRQAATPLGYACPSIDEKIEGAHTSSWLMTEATRPIAFGPDRFMDGRVFDPADIEAYLDGFRVRSAQSRLSSIDEAQSSELLASGS